MSHAIQLAGAGILGAAAGITWTWLVVLRRVLGIRWWQVPRELVEAWRG